jgi:hypothetical protein
VSHHSTFHIESVRIFWQGTADMLTRVWKVENPNHIPLVDMVAVNAYLTSSQNQFAAVEIATVFSSPVR